MLNSRFTPGQLAVILPEHHRSGSGAITSVVQDIEALLLIKALRATDLVGYLAQRTAENPSFREFLDERSQISGDPLRKGCAEVAQLLLRRAQSAALQPLILSPEVRAILERVSPGTHEQLDEAKICFLLLCLCQKPVVQDAALSLKKNALVELLKDPSNRASLEQLIRDEHTSPDCQLVVDEALHSDTTHQQDRSLGTLLPLAIFQLPPPEGPQATHLETLNSLYEVAQQFGPAVRSLLLQTLLVARDKAIALSPIDFPESSALIEALGKLPTPPIIHPSSASEIRSTLTPFVSPAELAPLCAPEGTSELLKVLGALDFALNDPRGLVALHARLLQKVDGLRPGPDATADDRAVAPLATPSASGSQTEAPPPTAMTTELSPDANTDAVPAELMVGIQPSTTRQHNESPKTISSDPGVESVPTDSPVLHLPGIKRKPEIATHSVSRPDLNTAAGCLVAIKDLTSLHKHGRNHPKRFGKIVEQLGAPGFITSLPAEDFVPILVGLAEAQSGKMRNEIAARANIPQTLEMLTAVIRFTERGVAPRLSTPAGWVRGITERVGKRTTQIADDIQVLVESTDSRSEDGIGTAIQLATQATSIFQRQLLLDALSAALQDPKDAQLALRQKLLPLRRDERSGTDKSQGATPLTKKRALTKIAGLLWLAGDNVDNPNASLDPSQVAQREMAAKTARFTLLSAVLQVAQESPALRKMLASPERISTLISKRVPPPATLQEPARDLESAVDAICHGLLSIKTSAPDLPPQARELQGTAASIISDGFLAELEQAKQKIRSGLIQFTHGSLAEEIEDLDLTPVARELAESELPLRDSGSGLLLALDLAAHRGKTEIPEVVMQLAKGENPAAVEIPAEQLIPRLLKIADTLSIDHWPTLSTALTFAIKNDVEPKPSYTREIGATTAGVSVYQADAYAPSQGDGVTTALRMYAQLTEGRLPERQSRSGLLAGAILRALHEGGVERQLNRVDLSTTEATLWLLHGGLAFPGNNAAAGAIVANLCHLAATRQEFLTELSGWFLPSSDTLCRSQFSASVEAVFANRVSEAEVLQVLAVGLVKVLDGGNIQGSS
ncbi:MAG: hypothetical protein EBZ48_01325, partial [Proteobacteria bacterium]|nr:hypothetical protein [Pseudomonadota bacterium]